MDRKITETKGVNHPKTKIGLTKMNKLIEAAEELFTTKGFTQTSISDICKKAETAVGTFYIYFDSKTDIYRVMMSKYEKEIKSRLAKAINDYHTRVEMEREGIRCFIKYAVENPNVYNIIWGSLSIDRALFINYYVSFAKSYTMALDKFKEELNPIDHTAVAYMLMGISNFLGLKAMFEGMTDEEIDKMVDESIMPALSNGVFK
jgi:AcrR family transcriptional regulator